MRKVSAVEGLREECEFVSAVRSFSLLNFSERHDDISDNRAHCTFARLYVSVHHHHRAVSGSRSHARLRVRIRGNAASAVAALLSSAATMKNYPEAAKEREIAGDEEGRREKEREGGRDRKRETKKREKERPSERRVENVNVGRRGKKRARARG